MKATTHNTRARGILVEEMPWGWYARGTREALIQHGITLEGPFPGDPGEKKTICKAIDPLGREVTIRRRSKTTFSVFRDWSEEEEAARKVQLQHEQKIQAAKDLVASWPKSSAAFRERAINTADITLGMLEATLLDGESGGYRYSDATANRIERLVDEMIHLVKTAAIVEDMELRAKHTPACIAEEWLAAGAAYAANPDESRIQYGRNVIPFRKPCSLGTKPL